MIETYVTLATHPLLWTFVALLAIFYLIQWSVRPDTEAPAPNRETGLLPEFGLARLPRLVVVVGVMIWGTLLCALVLGLFWIVWRLAGYGLGESAVSADDLRATLLTLTAQTATLGAVIALPFSLLRIRLTAAQNATADESLFNDKINAATTDLYAQRQVTERYTDPFGHDQTRDIWQDDVIKRNAAIDRLEGLVEERPDTAPRIARMLSVYVRELSREFPKNPMSEGEDPKALKTPTKTRTLPRSDLEKAAQTLGRIRTVSNRPPEELPIDLRGANLQGFTLAGLDFRQAQFDGAQLQGANLREAQLQSAFLLETQLQGACLSEAKLQRTNFSKTHMDEVDLNRAELQQAHFHGARLGGADLSGAKLRGAILYSANFSRIFFIEMSIRVTSFENADFRGAGLKEIDCTIERHQILGLDKGEPIILALMSQKQINDSFGDASVILGDLQKPDHWDQSTEPLDLDVFEKNGAHGSAVLGWTPTTRREGWGGAGQRLPVGWRWDG